jgi:hypothetical protein
MIAPERIRAAIQNCHHHSLLGVATLIEELAREASNYNEYTILGEWCMRHAEIIGKGMAAVNADAAMQDMLGLMKK